jgi:outer membrane protein OmpA-like peptidoglycan-associated protein
MTRFLRVLPLALAAALSCAAVSAETIVHYREGQVVDAADVARLLAPRTRSIRLLDEPAAEAPASAVAVVATPVVHISHSTPADSTGLSLPVRFAFGSADILPAARVQLDALATGIKMLPVDTVITIEGHTDATGSDAYNLELSRGRARSVRDYLMQRHGIDGSHLKAAGYGESRPIEGSDPYAGANRRVEFRSS